MLRRLDDIVCRFVAVQMYEAFDASAIPSMRNINDIMLSWLLCVLICRRLIGVLVDLVDLFVDGLIWIAVLLTSFNFYQLHLCTLL